MREDFDILREMVERILGASCALFFGASRCQTHANECMQEFHAGNPIKATDNRQPRYKVFQTHTNACFDICSSAYRDCLRPSREWQWQAVSQPRGAQHQRTRRITPKEFPPARKSQRKLPKR